MKRNKGIMFVLSVLILLWLLSCATPGVYVTVPQHYESLTQSQRGRYLHLLDQVNKLNYSNAQNNKVHTILRH